MKTEEPPNFLTIEQGKSLLSFMPLKMFSDIKNVFKFHEKIIDLVSTTSFHQHFSIPAFQRRIGTQVLHYLDKEQDKKYCNRKQRNKKSTENGTCWRICARENRCLHKDAIPLFFSTSMSDIDEDGTVRTKSLSVNGIKAKV